MASEAYQGRPAFRRGPGSLATGLLVVGALGLAGLAAARYLGLDPDGLLPGAGGLRLAGDFFSRALSPALAYEGSYVVGGPVSVLTDALQAALRTVMFAAAAISLSIVGGSVLGFLATSAWWDQPGVPRRAFPLVTALARGLITLMRSVHELVWAVLLLAALGTGQLVAVIAIAIPYSGTLAKVFSEMVEEAPRDASHALALAGASPLQALCFGGVPRAVPDMLAYTFYRFECALRSSAVMGFFGFPTLGYHISASFENLHYGEVWTHLYVLFGLILLVDAWSGRLRQAVLS